MTAYCLAILALMRLRGQDGELWTGVELLIVHTIALVDAVVVAAAGRGERCGGWWVCWASANRPVMADDRR